MRKRLLLLFMVIAIVLTIAPAAMADHCRTCKFNLCRPATVPAYYFCDDSSGTCILSGPGCSGPHPFAPEDPFAAEFVVASVERLDNRQPIPAGQTAEQIRVASLETPAPSSQH